ncbi:hypothetical protein BDN72DRAFT_838646 [Pluteus cervinus]|uniref:Uncharacterized protein n=1 Tax=Pluteus cervinus TaxID=181527 RepID=A0ACD3AZD9_9AGAR|nr:hypothetical protein BDN72DRAFT_838646 [Pluteus cervinus]
MVDIPVDILQEFIAYLHTEKNDTNRRKHLLSCCLVSHYWKSIAQPILFSRVILRTKSSERTELFAEAITQFPHLQRLVVALWLEGPFHECPKLKQIAEALQTLQQIRIHIGDIPRPIALIPVLPGLLRSERLTSLSILDVPIPVRLLNQCISLRELELREATLTGVDEALNSPAIIRTNRPRLKLLSFFARKIAETRILKWLMSTPHCLLDVSQVEIVLLSDRSGTVEGHQIYCDFLRYIAPSVRILFLDPPLEYSDIPPSLHMPPFPGMTDIRVVSLGMRENYYSACNPLPWMVDFLGNIPCPHLIEEVYIHGALESELSKEEPDSLQQGWPESWASLDTSLTSSRFGHVKKIHMYLYDEFPSQEKREALANLLTRKLPTIASQNRLAFTFIYPEDDSVLPEESHWACIQSGPWRYGVSY